MYQHQQCSLSLLICLSTSLMYYSRFKLRHTTITNPALPEGGSTGTSNSNSAIPSPVPTVRLSIRNTCTGGSLALPVAIVGIGPSGAAEALVKELISVHPDPQRLTQAILTATSSYSNTTNLQVIITINFYKFTKF